MSMRIGVAVDCGCDLPYEFFRKHKVTILPGTVKFTDGAFTDDRSEAATLGAYRRGFRDLAPGEDASAVTADHVREVFLGKLITDYDFIFCLTTASARSPVYANAMQAAGKVLSEYRPIRAKAGVNGTFALRVLDSKNLGGGYAVLCAETVNRIVAGDSPQAIRTHIEELIPHTYGYYLIRDFATVRKRIREKGDASIGWLKFMLGQALNLKPLLVAHNNDSYAAGAISGFDRGARKCFEFIGQRIEAGLKLPVVSISYGGDLAELKALPGYDALLAVAEKHKVTVYTSMMSVSAAAVGSAGSLSFGFCAPPHKFE